MPFDCQRLKIRGPGLALPFTAFRVSRFMLTRLHDSKPRIATLLAQALIYAVPIGMIKLDAFF